VCPSLYSWLSTIINIGTKSIQNNHESKTQHPACAKGKEITLATAAVTAARYIHLREAAMYHLLRSGKKRSD